MTWRVACLYGLLQDERGLTFRAVARLIEAGLVREYELRRVRYGNVFLWFYV